MRLVYNPKLDIIGILEDTVLVRISEDPVYMVLTSEWELV